VYECGTEEVVVGPFSRVSRAEKQVNVTFRSVTDLYRRVSVQGVCKETTVQVKGKESRSINGACCYVSLHVFNMSVYYVDEGDKLDTSVSDSRCCEGCCFL